MANTYNKPMYLNDLGDGLFEMKDEDGTLGDIFCMYRPVSAVSDEEKCIFTYTKYTVTIKYTTNEDGKRTYTGWERRYSNG